MESQSLTCSSCMIRFVLRLITATYVSRVLSRSARTEPSADTYSHTHTYTHTHTHTHPFNGPLSGTTRVSWYQKGKKPIRFLLKQDTASGSGISWAVCKSAPRSRQITTPAPHHSVFFTGQMLFLPPNQQRQSTEGKPYNHRHTSLNIPDTLLAKKET